MLWKLGLSFLFCISVYGQAPPPAPAPAPSPAPTPAQIQAAQEQGTATGEQVGSQVSTYDQQGLSTQSTSYSSLEKSSADSMMNSQVGQASASMMSGSLYSAAAPYATSCDPSNLSGIEACATGSVLTGMSGQMTDSSATFGPPINQAWNNVCHFSTIGCSGQVIPNPYDPIVAQNPPPTPAQYQQLVSDFASKGYNIDPKTGIVTTPDGKKIDPNSKKSIESALGGDGKTAMTRLIDKMQKDIASKLAKVKKDSYLHALGLDSLRAMGQKLVDAVTGESRQSKKQADFERNRKVRYNILPEKARDKIEISEMRRNFNGTPIGVAAANIFKMIKKRYEIKSSEKVFLSPELKMFKQTQSN
jgi:hypothetical protein